jgi:hypothetical protein
MMGISFGDFRVMIRLEARLRRKSPKPAANGLR